MIRVGSSAELAALSRRWHEHLFGDAGDELRVSLQPGVYEDARLDLGALPREAARLRVVISGPEPGRVVLERASLQVIAGAVRVENVVLRGHPGHGPLLRIGADRVDLVAVDVVDTTLPAPPRGHAAEPPVGVHLQTTHGKARATLTDCRFLSVRGSAPALQISGQGAGHWGAVELDRVVVADVDPPAIAASQVSVLRSSRCRHLGGSGPLVDAGVGTVVLPPDWSQQPEPLERGVLDRLRR